MSVAVVAAVLTAIAVVLAIRAARARAALVPARARAPRGRVPRR